ncbi:protein-tyrosine phosphatase domain-containing protein [Ditylenchus destructor]|uniref:Protein-tyrosine phosphatase domain-containing protein n=1 Tax=Ditylenchus destructor TaxID=166010 RepID=A0AAD4MWT3_9BILA|nr:protein-tyrosine phosphatase domain-containing protein [Ditylenchus destructor]
MANEKRNKKAERVSRRNKVIQDKIHAAKTRLHTAINDDDGTQVEKRTPVRASKTRSLKIKKRGLGCDDPESRNLLREFCLQAMHTGVEGLRAEFNQLKAETMAPPSNIAQQANKDKNRYQDVFCTDETRVKLKWPALCNDYVHANWVDFKGGKKFICTQGPIEATVPDIWRLVWQEKCRAIVMLCEFEELGKKKCECYWPIKERESMPAGLMTIKNLGIETKEKMLTITKLSILPNDEKSATPLEVMHIKWNHWPDRGVPQNKMAAFRLLHKMQDFDPVLVHCSAGIGRTGTIVGLYMALQVLNSKEPLSMPMVIRELRSRRHGSVQTDMQYVFMHRAIINFAENKNLLKEEEVAQFNEKYEEYVKPFGN